MDEKDMLSEGSGEPEEAGYEAVPFSDDVPADDTASTDHLTEFASGSDHESAGETDDDDEAGGYYEYVYNPTGAPVYDEPVYEPIADTPVYDDLPDGYSDLTDTGYEPSDTGAGYAPSGPDGCDTGIYTAEDTSAYEEPAYEPIDEIPPEPAYRSITDEPAEAAPPPPPPQSVNAGSSYDPFMYEPIGFDRRDHYAAEQLAAETAAREKKIRARQERSVVVTFFIIALCAIALSVYGIISDVFRSGSGRKFGSGSRVILYQNSKPEGANDMAAEKDASGKYTTEGAAAAVRSSIVEIYTYTNAAKTTLEGTGSGVVISDDGFIVTNAHVLLANGFHTVNTVDGRSFSARIVGRDAKTDIAVIKVNTDDLVPAVLGDSDEMLVGEKVIAIGNPAGLSSTVTDGIVSAVNRKIRSDSTGFQMDCIQTNAAISPGNSGGALVNMYGQVIGITSSKYVSSSYEGLGFAITINEARPIIEDLIKNGFIPGRFRVGITFIETATDARRALVNQELGFEMPEDFGGLYVTEVSEDCDISNTDLKAGDFIYSIDDVNVRNYDQFNAVVTASYGPGDRVKAKCAHLEEDGSIEYYEIEFMLMEDTSGDF